jgi:hypothetical protein
MGNIWVVGGGSRWECKVNYFVVKNAGFHTKMPDIKTA